MTPCIPHTIHYCWFGGNPLGEKELRCIESWKKYLPDYEIVRWDESNFDVRCCDYVSEAYDVKKWAFVSDYARFKVLYDNGGLYFDTDVEIIRPMDDIIAAGPFMGFETDCAGSGNNSVATGEGGAVATGLGLSVNPGLGLCANPGLGLYKRILDSYASDHFVNSDGTTDETTVVTRVTGILKECGLQDVSGIQQVSGVMVYPSEYFNPKNFFTGKINLTGNTRSVHHFDASWYSPAEKYEHRIATILRSKGVSDGMAKKAAALLRVIRYVDISRIKSTIHNRVG